MGYEQLESTGVLGNYEAFALVGVFVFPFYLSRERSSSMLLGGSRPADAVCFDCTVITSSRFQPRYRTLIYRRSCLVLEIPKKSTFMYHPSTCSVHHVCPEAMDLVSRTQFDY